MELHACVQRASLVESASCRTLGSLQVRLVCGKACASPWIRMVGYTAQIMLVDHAEHSWLQLGHPICAVPALAYDKHQALATFRLGCLDGLFGILNSLSYLRIAKN